MDKLELLEQKRINEIKLAKLRAKLTEAKADARRNGRYMPPAQFAQMELDVRLLSQRSQAIQAQLSALKANAQVDVNDCFRDAAKKLLPEKTFLVILEMAHDIKRSREIGSDKEVPHA